MKVLETLKSAREALDTPEKWARGSSARSASGRKVAVQSKRAAAFCAAGAICRAGGAGSELTRNALFRVFQALPFEPEKRFGRHWGNLSQVPSDRGGISGPIWEAIARVSDDPSTTHADILALFDRAIAAEEAAQPRRPKVSIP